MKILASNKCWHAGFTSGSTTFFSHQGKWIKLFGSLTHQGKWIKLFGSLTVIGCTRSLFSDPVLLNPLGIIGHSSYRWH